MKKVRKPKSKIYDLIGGPFHRERISLTCGWDPKTFCFCVGRHSGHYKREIKNGRVVMGNNLHWVPLLMAIAPPTPPAARPGARARAQVVPIHPRARPRS